MNRLQAAVGNFRHIDRLDRGEVRGVPIDCLRLKSLALLQSIVRIRVIHLESDGLAHVDGGSGLAVLEVQEALVEARQWLIYLSLHVDRPVELSMDLLLTRVRAYRQRLKAGQRNNLALRGSSQFCRLILLVMRL